MEDIEQFFAAAERGAKLVFCSAGKVLQVTQQARDKKFEVFIDCRDLTRIRDMHGYCLIVTDESLMRGVDYRLKEEVLHDATDGIDLLVACSFSNSRAYKQGQARVGRYNEPCTRYILKGVSKVDEQQVKELKAELARRMD